MRKKYLLFFFLLAGFIFRLFWIVNFPQPLRDDQLQYYGAALGILQKGFFYVDSFRVYGYPLILAFLFKILGSTDVFAAKILNAGFDTASALLVFLLAKKLFKKESAAWVAFLLYLFNPFTVSYTGTLLTENAAIFFLTLIIFILVKLHQRKTIILMLLLSFLLGFYPQIKPGFLGFSICLFFYCYCLCSLRSRSLFAHLPRRPWACSKVFAPRELHNLLRYFLCFLSPFIFFLPFIYNLVGNQRYFKTFSLLSADNVFVRELYISLFVNKTLPNIDEPQNMYPPQVWTIYAEYSIPVSGAGKKAMAEKYLRLSISEIKKEPLKFIRWRIEKMWYVWEKHNLFPYYFNPSERLVNLLVYGGNLLLLGLFTAGLVLWAKERGGWFVKLTLFLVFYISFFHAFSITEERFSLPFYPLICLFAGYAISIYVFQAEIKNKRADG